jgi:glyoxylase-like metal-dependent hydrolase (beta-lactamase superfamily II)
MRTSLLAVTAVLLAAPAASQQQDYSKVEIKVEQVAPGVAVLFGAGGNIGVSYGPDGNVLIDDQFAPLVPKIIAAVKGIDPDPVSFLINTHWHGDHTGGNEALGSAGTVIVAQDNVRKRLAVDTVSKRYGYTAKALGKAGLPVITFTREISFHLNGDTLQVVHVPRAHTDGDSLIYWAGANVLHMGDTFFHKETYPFIDRDSGGSIDGMIAAAKRGLALVKPGGRAIPGHGPVATRAELQAYHDMLVDVRGKVAAGIRAGRSRAQVIASKLTAVYASTIASDGFIKPDNFVGGIYDDLKAVPRR